MLSRWGVQDSRAPHENRPIGYIVDGFMYPNLKIYENERHPSPNGARDLWKQITEKENNNGYKLEGKYLTDNCTK